MHMIHIVCLLLMLVVPCKASPDETDKQLARRISITFDDVPIGGPDPGIRHVEEINRTILRHLREHSVPAVGFVNERLLHHPYEIDRRERILASWYDAGFELGNHTYSHLDLHLSGVEQFIADVKKGETFTASLSRQRGSKIRYFRFPYLHEGLTPDVRNAVFTRIKSMGYTIAPVSITNDDFIFSTAYHQAGIAGNIETQRWIGEAYVRYLEEIVVFHEEKSQYLFGRNIAHIIIFHVNELNADLMGAILKMFKSRGYSFISLGAALMDPAYRHEDNYFGRQGLSALQRWFHTAGKMKYWGREPSAPRQVIELFKQAGASAYE